MNLDIKNIDAFIFDFDGVLTNNKVFVNENGTESVLCSRSDGLAFDVLRKINKKFFILSTETNQVVARRAEKIQANFIQASTNKGKSIDSIAKKYKLSPEKLCYIGNDINDLEAMNICGLSICPNDAHNLVKKASQLILKSNGGDGVARELIEEVCQLDFVKISYKS